MRAFICISILLLTIWSCKEIDKKESIVDAKNSWSQERIKKYFIDSIALRKDNGKYAVGDSLNDFNQFSTRFFSNIKAKNIKDPLIFALNENYIDTTVVDTKRDWLRITVDPCFDIPYCIIIEKINNNTQLIIKMTNGYGCYVSGYLNFVNSQLETDIVYNNISQKLNDLNFWKLKNDTTCAQVLDGEYWTFEAISKGKYNLVNRHNPMGCISNETKVLVSIAEDLKKLSRFNDFLNLKKQTIKKVMIED